MSTRLALHVGHTAMHPRMHSAPTLRRRLSVASEEATVLHSVDVCHAIFTFSLYPDRGRIQSGYVVEYVLYNVSYK